MVLSNIKRQTHHHLIITIETKQVADANNDTIMHVASCSKCSAFARNFVFLANPPARGQFPPRQNVQAWARQHHPHQQQRRFTSGVPPPKLSRRSRRDLVIVVGGAIGSWIYIRNSDWDRDVNEEKHRLLNLASRQAHISQQESLDMDVDNFKGAAHHELDGLPLPLRTYLEKIFKDQSVSSRRRNLVSVEQSGEFYAAQQWYPFMSQLLALAPHSESRGVPPGFIWEANVEILKMPNRVLETYIDGKGSIITKAWGIIPMIQMEEEEPFILFWLAMIPLIPSAFLGSGYNNGDRDPTFSWDSIHDLSSCSGQLFDKKIGSDGGVAFQMALEFYEDSKLLKSIKVTAPILSKTWQVNYFDYKQMNVLVPSKIEVGNWTGDDEFTVHLRIINHDAQFYDGR